jgi:hypothetical protein
LCGLLHDDLFVLLLDVLNEVEVLTAMEHEHLMVEQVVVLLQVLIQSVVLTVSALVFE